MRFYHAFKKEAHMERAGEQREDRTGNRTTGQAKWTFLVYMAGHNNFDGAALRDIAEIKAKADAVIAALKPGKGRTILCQGKIGREVRGTCGLSIYFPADRINSAYRTRDFNGDCKWIAFLEKFLS
jgi:hypothetical protein